MSAAVEPVIAGSRGFALALLAPLTEQIGTRPRVAAGAAAAAPLCGGSHGLVVVEFLGAQTLREIAGLVAGATGVRVVAAVPAQHAAADAPLRALGVEVARWDGSSAAILGAVGRQLALPTAAQPSAPPRPVAPAAAVRAPQPQPVARVSPPDALPAASPRPAARAPAAARTPRPASAPPAAPVPHAPPPAWPAGVPGPAQAAAALREALAGAAETAGSIAAQVAAGLSDLERAVVAGELQPFDDAPISDASAMRVRVAAALATAPKRGEPIDAAAVSALLGDFDALLSRVNETAEAAPDGARASIESIRDDLVRLAIRFSQRAAPAEPEPAPAPAAAPPPRTRIVAPDSPAEHAPRSKAKWLALALAVALAAGYHVHRWQGRRALRAARSTGAPTGMLDISAGPSAPRVLVPASAGRRPDAAEIARIKAAEEARGNVVHESDGVLVILPARPATAAATSGPEGAR
jgi:hypothetical protein